MGLISPLSLGIGWITACFQVSGYHPSAIEPRMRCLMRSWPTGFFQASSRMPAGISSAPGAETTDCLYIALLMISSGQLSRIPQSLPHLDRCHAV